MLQGFIKHPALSSLDSYNCLGIIKSETGVKACYMVIISCPEQNYASKIVLAYTSWLFLFSSLLLLLNTPELHNPHTTLSFSSTHSSVSSSSYSVSWDCKGKLNFNFHLAPEVQTAPCTAKHSFSRGEESERCHQLHMLLPTENPRSTAGRWLSSTLKQLLLPLFCLLGSRLHNFNPGFPS